MIRAARYGFSLMLAIIGGPPARFAPFSQLFHEALREFGQPSTAGRRARSRPCRRNRRASSGRVLAAAGARRSRASSKERGFRPPTEESFAQDVGPGGALYVGSAQTVADKIVANLELLGASRFDLKFGMPGLTHDQIMTTIELYGTQVIPRVRELVGSDHIA